MTDREKLAVAPARPEYRGRSRLPAPAILAFGGGDAIAPDSPAFPTLRAPQYANLAKIDLKFSCSTRQRARWERSGPLRLSLLISTATFLRADSTLLNYICFYDFLGLGLRENLITMRSTPAFYEPPPEKTLRPPKAFCKNLAMSGERRLLGEPGKQPAFLILSKYLGPQNRPP